MIPHNNQFDYKLDSKKLQWIQHNKHLCIIPYIEVDTRSIYINPCCHYDSLDSDKFAAFDFNHFIGSKFDFDNPNGRIVEIKKNIESTTLDKNCNFCHKQESNNQISSRVRQLLQHSSDDITDWLTNKKLNEFTNIVTFGNECNMACRMCGSHNSNLFESIWSGNKKSKPIRNISDDPKVWEVLKSSIRSQIDSNYEVYRIVVLGGEGTIQADLYKLADWLIAEKLSDKVNLQITTNGSVFLDEVFKKWCKNFKHLSFAISVDSAHADNYRYVRYPVKFEKISNNLQHFKNLSAKYHNMNFHITPIFYINNIAYLKDFIDYFEQFDQRGTLSINDNTLSDPTYLQLKNLPMAIKQQLIKQISPLIDGYRVLDRNEIFKLSIRSMLDQLEIDNFSIESWKQYLSTSARWDKLTNTDISFHNKKLWDLFSEDDKALYYQYKNDHDH